MLGGDYIFRFANRPFRFTAEAYYKALSRLIPYQVDNVRIVYYGKMQQKDMRQALILNYMVNSFLALIHGLHFL